MSDRMQAYIEQLGRQAKEAARQLATASTERKNAALNAAAASLLQRCGIIVHKTVDADSLPLGTTDELASTKSNNETSKHADVFRRTN